MILALSEARGGRYITNCPGDTPESFQEWDEAGGRKRKKGRVRKVPVDCLIVEKNCGGGCQGKKKGKESDAMFRTNRRSENGEKHKPFGFCDVNVI